MRKYFLELFAIGLVDSEGRINKEHMTSDALMTAMKTMEELTQMKMSSLKNRGKAHKCEGLVRMFLRFRFCGIVCCVLYRFPFPQSDL